MHHLVKTEIVPLTQELAEHFSRLPSFKGDRPRDTVVGRRRIAWLSELLDSGRFHTPKWATVELGGVVYRINGGHSSLMLASRNGNFPSSMSVVIDRFACDTRNDLADLFDQFDGRISVRTSVDKINAHKGAYDDLDDISTTDISRILSGIAFFLAGDGKFNRLDEEDRLRLVETNRPFIRWASQYSGRKHFSLVGVLAAMHATWKHSQQAAEVFWLSVLEESSPNPENPTRVLSSFLKENMGKKKPGTATSLWSPRAFFVKSIFAWNAWREHRPTNLAYCPDNSWPRIR